MSRTGLGEVRRVRRARGGPFPIAPPRCNGSKASGLGAARGAASNGSKASGLGAARGAAINGSKGSAGWSHRGGALSGSAGDASPDRGVAAGVAARAAL